MRRSLFFRTGLCGWVLLWLMNCQGVNAEIVPVYLAAGQSNAKLAWANSIQATLRELDYDSTVVAHSMHSGHWLNSWYTDEPNFAYYDDLNVVVTTMNEIAAAGDTPVFAGLFWFQGEGDTTAYTEMDLYQSRFNSLLAQYQFDLGVSSINYAIMVIDANPDFDLPPLRTWEKIEYMRAIHFELGNADNGVGVDTRPYDRIDSWHLPTSELIELGVETATVFHSRFLRVQSVAPHRLAVVRGVHTSGNLKETEVSDDGYVKFVPGFAINAGEPPVWLEFAGVLPTDRPTSLSLRMESASSAATLQQQLEMFNYDSLSFELVDSRVATFSDSVVVIPALGNARRAARPGFESVNDARAAGLDFRQDVFPGSENAMPFVQPGIGMVQARVTWKPVGILLLKPWLVRIDHFVWNVTD